MGQVVIEYSDKPLVAKPEGWEKRLADYLEANHSTAFEWGQFDCCLFTLDCVDAQIGTEFAVEWRGKYDSAVSAYKLLEDNGGYEEIIKGYGFVQKDVNMASRGDIAFIDGDFAWGVVIGDRIIGAGDNGLVSLGIENALTVWELPCLQ